MSELPIPVDALFDGAPCGLVVTAADGTILAINATLLNWVGRTRDELVGVRRFSELLTIGGRVFQQTHWGPLLSMQGSVAEVKVEINHRDGRRIPMLLNAVRREWNGVACNELALLIVNDRHKYERELLSTRNALREVNDQLSRANRLKTEFLATLAHELRNPLAPIRNGLQIIKASVSPIELAKTREMMDRQVSHMVRLIDDLLDVSRIASGKLELRKAVVTLAEVVDSAVETSLPVIRAGRIELEVDLPEAPIHLDADLTRLSQVVSNVLNNAAKFTPAQGRVHLCASLAGEEVFIRIRDSGVGIPPAQLESIFDMFGQLESTLQRTQGGLGIGLALARTLVTLHGGTIAAESEGTGRGAMFVIRLPVTHPSFEPDPKPAVTLQPPRALRILVTDDLVDNAESIALLLRIGGHEVEMASNGAECLAKAASFAPDVILLDVGLPDIDGYEVARRLRASADTRSIALVALTGWGSEADKALSVRAGFERHFTKPVALDELMAWLADRFGIGNNDDRTGCVEAVSNKV